MDKEKQPQSSCLKQINANWAGKEKLFYCKNSTVGMNKKDFPKKPTTKTLNIHEQIKK